jgi:hypothetical protein
MDLSFGSEGLSRQRKADFKYKQMPPGNSPAGFPISPLKGTTAASCEENTGYTAGTTGRATFSLGASRSNAEIIKKRKDNLQSRVCFQSAVECHE